MTYQDRRRANRDRLKAELLVILQAAEQTGETVNIAGLAIKLKCSPSTLHAFRHEFAQLGLVPDPEVRRVERYERPDVVPHIAERIAAVREAKFKHWRETGEKILTEEELDKILPS